jgi:chromosome segregation ATPase
MAQNINVTSLFYVNIDNNNKITKLIPNTTVKITQADIDTILNYYNKHGFLIMDFSINTNLNDINTVFMNLANNNTNNIIVADKDNTIVRITSNTANIILNSGLIFKVENAEKIIIPKVYFSIDKNNFILNLEKIFPSNIYVYNMVKNILQNSFNYLITLDNYKYEMLLNKFINTILLTSFNTEIYNYFGRNNRLSSDIMNNIINYFSGELCMFNHGVVNVPPNLCVINNLTEKHCFNFIDPLQKNIYDLTTNNTSNTTKINTLNTQITALTNEKNSTYATLQEANNKITTLTGQITSLDIKNKSCDDLLTKSTTEKNKALNDLDTLNIKTNNLNSQISSLTADKSTCNTNLSSITSQLSTTKGIVTNLTNDKNTLQSSLDSANKNISSLNSQFTSLTNEKNTLDSQCKSSINELNTKVTDLTNTNNQTLTNLNTCKKEGDTVKIELIKLTDNNTKLKISVDNANIKAENESKLKDTAIKSLDLCNNQTNIIKSELNNEKANTNTEIKLKQDALNRIDKLNNEKNILSESKFECDNNVTDLNNKLTKSKSDIKTLNETLIYEETDKIRIISLYNNLTKDYTDVNAKYIAEQLVSKKTKQELKTLKEESEGIQMNFSTLNLWTGTTILFFILTIVFVSSKK